MGAFVACYTGRAAAELAPLPTAEMAASGANDLQEITVTAERLGLMGNASTATEGIIVNEELQLTPAFRVGQLLETVPRLQVTSHSGEGKANQYLLRGYNLDHDTDLGTFVDDMPVKNRLMRMVRDTPISIFWCLSWLPNMFIRWKDGAVA